MSARSVALLLLACACTTCRPLANFNGDDGSSGVILKLRSPAPGQNWQPTDLVQVHINIDVTEGPAADAVLYPKRHHSTIQAYLTLHSIHEMLIIYVSKTVPCVCV
jgi:hypothetical protein